MEIFPEIGPRKFFFVPPNSAPGLRPWAPPLYDGAILTGLFYGPAILWVGYFDEAISSWAILTVRLSQNASVLVLLEFTVRPYLLYSLHLVLVLFLQALSISIHVLCKWVCCIIRVWLRELLGLHFSTNICSNCVCLWKHKTCIWI